MVKLSLDTIIDNNPIKNKTLSEDDIAKIIAKQLTQVSADKDKKLAESNAALGWGGYRQPSC